MTCIVGIEDEGRVLIGGDSAGSAGHQVAIRADEKVWRSGEFVYGFTSSFRMGQILRYSLSLPRRPESDAGSRECYRWMCTEFIDAVREALKEGGFARVDNGVERGGIFLVGWRGALYRVEGDFQVGRVLSGEDAAGCGEEFALGALFALRGKQSARRRVRLALEAAATHSGSVAPPFRVVSA